MKALFSDSISNRCSRLKNSLNEQARLAELARCKGRKLATMVEALLAF